MKNIGEKLFILVIATSLVGCGWIKKSSKEKESKSDEFVVETEQTSEEVPADLAVDSFGLALFDEEVNSGSGWQSDQVEFKPDLSITDENLELAKATVTACLALPVEEVGSDLGFIADAATAVCASDAKNLNLGWKSETVTNQ